MEGMITVICLYVVLTIAVTVIILIAIIKTYYHIKRTANTLERIEADQIKIADQLSSQMSLNSRAEFNQYYYDHCFMNGLGPHEWVPSGKQTNSDFEFVCHRCGQTVNVPRRIAPEHPYTTQLKEK